MRDTLRIAEWNLAKGRHLARYSPGWQKWLPAEPTPNILVIPDPPRLNHPLWLHLGHLGLRLSEDRKSWQDGIAVVADRDIQVKNVHTNRHEGGRYGDFLHVRIPWAGDLEVLAMYIRPLKKLPGKGGREEAVRRKAAICGDLQDYIRIKGLMHLRTLAIGDLNMVFDTVKDVIWRGSKPPKSQALPSDPADFMATLHNCNFIDSWRSCHGERRLETHRQKNGFRLDYILLSEALRHTLIASGAHVSMFDLDTTIWPSDHLPIWADLSCEM